MALTKHGFKDQNWSSFWGRAQKRMGEGEKKKKGKRKRRRSSNKIKGMELLNLSMNLWFV